MFVKLHSSILDSSVWDLPAAHRCVWITLLASADAGGVVNMSASGLARRSNVTRAEANEALKSFQSQDPDSRNPRFGGRRIERAAKGWQLLNYAEYRRRGSVAERLESDAARKKAARKLAKEQTCPQAPADGGNVPKPSAPRPQNVRNAEGEAELEENPGDGGTREDPPNEPPPAETPPKRMALNWAPHPSSIPELAKHAQCSESDIEKLANEFKGYWTIGGGQGKSRTHWQAKWRTWALGRIAEGKVRSGGKPAGATPYDAQIQRIADLKAKHAKENPNGIV